MGNDLSEEFSTDFFKNKKIAITGVTGFIGNRLAKELIGNGAAIYVLTHKNSKNTWRISDIVEKMTRVETNLCNQEEVYNTLRKIDPDFIYHMATYYSVNNNVDFSEIIDTNIKASVMLLKACEGLKELKLFVNVGTCAEYGDLKEEANENSKLNPNSIYASTKAANTIILHQLAKDCKIPLTTLRLYNIYGEFEKPQRFVPYIILSLLNQETVKLTNCEQAKDYSYLGDIVNAFLKAAENFERAKGEIFNIGSGNTIQMRDLVEEIVRQVGYGQEFVKFGALKYRENEMWHQGTIIEKAKEYLGWKPKVDLKEGLKRTIKWYQKNLNLY